MHDRNSHRLFASLILICVINALGGCGGTKEDEPAATAVAPSVDPRYATAEAMVGEFNVKTTRDPVDVAGTLTLMYAENQRQRDLVQIAMSMIPIYGLEDAMQKHFRQPIDPNTPKAFSAKPNGPATITKNEGERATATYKESDGKTETLQLVKHDGRWWLSGYTLEHADGMKDATEDDVTFARITMKHMAAASPAMAARINSGEFKSAAAARQALQAALLQQMMNSPADTQVFRDLALRNPKYAAMFKPNAQGK